MSNDIRKVMQKAAALESYESQEACEGRMAHNNGWNEGNCINHKEKMNLIPFHLFRSSHMSLSSPI
jgi:hypothetical protein